LNPPDESSADGFGAFRRIRKRLSKIFRKIKAGFSKTFRKNAKAQENRKKTHESS